MKKILSTAVIAALGLGSATAFARPHGDLARVVASTPVYESIQVPQERCWTQPVTTYENRAVQSGYVTRPAIGAGTVIGAVLGGVVGHQAGGSDRARDAATVAGALIGGVVGNQVDRSRGVGYVAQPAYYHQPVAVTRDVRRCDVVPTMTQRLVGYDVRYVYAGREYVTRMAEAPGRTIRVNVNVTPGGFGPHRAAYGPATPVYVR